MVHPARRALQRPRRFGPWSIVFALGLWAPCAAAQSEAPPDLATRRMLIDQAQQARTAGDHRLALERAEQAMRIQLTPSLRLFVAQTLVLLERPADALTQAEGCVREAERDTSLPNRDALLQSCRQVLVEVRPAIATLRLVLRGALPSNASITVGSRAVSSALVDVPIALNPGRVTVVASAEGYNPIDRSIELGRGEQRSLELSFERTTQTAAPRAPERPVRATAPPRAATRPFPIGPVITLSAGAAALVVGIVTFALRNGEISACPIEGGRFVCPDSASAATLVARANSAESLNTVTNISLVAGGVLVAGGAAWLVVDRVVRREQTQLMVAPTATRSQLGVGVGGSF